MSGGATIAFLSGGRRLHMNHGPIDLVVEAFGAADETRLAYAQAGAAFEGLLEGLVAELVQLRTPMENDEPALSGPIARRMGAAVWPHRKEFVTPMAAVAGAVADHVLEAMVAGLGLDRAYVNNGGDIAVYLAKGQGFRTGVVQRVEAPSLDGIAEITAAMPVRGLATSGWRGRSHSLGVADAVTALARTAAAADVAATLIANAVRVDGPAVSRAPASELDADSDLGDRLVTVDVGPLDAVSVARALDAGVAAAEEMRARGLVWGAVLAVQGHLRVVGPERLIGQTAA